MRHNVLHIIADDLRPDLPPYNHGEVYAPHLTSLARRGVTFARAYCQIAVCSPSRMSIFTGRRPEQTGVFNFLNHARQADCGPALRDVSFVGVAGFSNLSAAPLTWREGGAAQCCTLCTAENACDAWTYQRASDDWHLPGDGNCNLFSANVEDGHGDEDQDGVTQALPRNALLARRGAPVPALGAVSGRRGDATMQAKLTTLPQAFRLAGYRRKKKEH